MPFIRAIKGILVPNQDESCIKIIANIWCNLGLSGAVKQSHALDISPQAMNAHIFTFLSPKRNRTWEIIYL